jgi:amino acid transporter
VPGVANSSMGVTFLWIVALLVFFVPQAIAVLDLSARFPSEGGIYIWTKVPFGDFHGFMSGWCYWTNNLAYVPALLVAVVETALLTFGADESASRFLPISTVVLLWLVAWLNIRGLKFGKGVQAFGAISTVLAVAFLVVIALYVWKIGHAANSIDIASLNPSHQKWETTKALGLVCFLLVGLELGSVMGEEIKRPKRSVPKAILFAGPCCIVLYIAATLALQILAPIHQIKDPTMITTVTAALKASDSLKDNHFIVPILTFFLTASIVGAICAWVAGPARIPFVVGKTRLLPAAFGSLHRRYHTPYKTIIAEAIISTAIVLLASVGGKTTRDIFDTLVRTAVVIQLISFLYLFASLIKTRRMKTAFEGDEPFFKRSWLPYAAGVMGFTTTALGLILQFFLPAGDDPWTKSTPLILICACAVFLLPGLFIYYWNKASAVKV